MTGRVFACSALLCALPLLTGVVSAEAQGVAGEVTNASQLEARANSSSSDGKTFHLRGGNYGDVDLSEARRGAMVTFKAYPGEQPVFDYTVFRDSERLRFEGVRWTDSIDIQQGNNRSLEFVGNDVGGFTGPGINLRETSTDILIQGNRFHDLRELGGDYASGYGVRVAGPYGPISGLRIIRNTFTRLGNDGIELGTVASALVQGNDISQVRAEPGSDAHADPMTIWADSKNVTIRNNRIHDNSQPVYLADGTENALFENNVVVRTDNFCIQAGGIGNRDDGIQNNVIRNNTLWDCGFGGLIVRGNGSGNVLVNNLIQSLSGSNLGRQFALEDFNLIGSGSRAGAHDLSGRPRFVDAAGADYHLAAGSPGIDAGTSDGVSATDADGAGRFDDPSVRNRGGGARPFYDLGAFERNGARGSPQARKRPARIRIRGLSLRPSRFRRAATVEFRLSKRGRVRFKVQAKRGNDWKFMGGFRQAGKRGHNRVRVTRGALGQSLRRGRYRLVARAVDRGGRRSKRAIVRFTLLAR